MQYNTEVEQSGRGRPIADALYATSENVPSLLNDERFLLSVFEHLVDYGLAECRLVCRKWREVSKQFPIELKSTKDEQLRKIGAFPNATSLTVNHRPWSMSDVEIFGQLGSLSNLRSLAFDGSYVSFGARAQPYIQLITKLTDLTIQYRAPGRTEYSLASLKYLTNLTRLILRWPSWKLQIYPLVELKNIQVLEIGGCKFFSEDGSCMFPSLTDLRYLRLTGGLTDGEVPVRSLEEISLFAGSLQHLCLCLGMCWATFDFTPFTSLTKLDTLSFEGADYCWRWFVQLLPQLCSLTKFQFSSYDCELDSTLAASIAKCSALKAFDCLNSFSHLHEQIYLFDVFKHVQLTELAVKFRWSLLPQLCCLTLLECLRLDAEFEVNSSLDEALNCMPNLRTLEIFFQDTNSAFHHLSTAGRLRLSGDVFSDMDHLSSVSLHRVDIGASFFRELASKTGLTRLEFTSSEHCHYPHSFMDQINLLRNLEVLTLEISGENEWRSLLSPTDLRKLRRLNVSGHDGNVAAVRRKFDQAMHPALVNRKESPWRSRSILS